MALMPRSLVGRVFALYALVLLIGVGAGLALFYRFQYTAELENAQQRAESLVQVVMPMVAESAVIGDYDTIRRTLERAIAHSDFSRASFIDVKGGVLRADGPPPSGLAPPAWLRAAIEQQLYDTNLPITVGGHDYGVLRLSFAAERMAGDLWKQSMATLALAAAAVLGGLLVLRVALGRWLGDFGRIQSIEQGLLAGAEGSVPLGGNAPSEFRDTFAILNRTISNMRTQGERLRGELEARESAMTALRGVLEGLLRQEPGASMDVPADDLAAISALIAQLVHRLQERGEQLRAIFGLSPDGFVAFDDRLEVNLVSPAFTRLTGITPAEVAGLGKQAFSRLLAGHCAASGTPLDLARLRDDAAAGDAGRRHLIDLERPARRTLQLSLRSGGGAGTRELLHLRDVTHETEVDKLKSEFLSTAAHELRTPMASIYGFSELMMLRPMAPDRQREVISTIHRQSARLISIINELLDLARIEARRGKDFAIESLDLGALARDVLGDYQAPDGRPAPRLGGFERAAPVRADRGKLTQALLNVLSNAYKYSAPGSDVHLRLVQARGDQHEFGLQVEDHGIGLTPQQLARVTERFYRADESGTVPGTGLGMSIVREIVELLGGRLALQSTPGAGTTVTLWLPAALEAAPIPEAWAPG